MVKKYCNFKEEKIEGLKCKDLEILDHTTAYALLYPFSELARAILRRRPKSCNLSLESKAAAKSRLFDVHDSLDESTRSLARNLLN